MMQTNRPKWRLKGKKQRLWLEPESLKGRQVPYMDGLTWRVFHWMLTPPIRTRNPETLRYRIVSRRQRGRVLLTVQNRLTPIAEWWDS